MAAQGGGGDFPNYEKERARIREFIEGYRSPTTVDGELGDPKYLRMVAAIHTREAKRFDVSLDDVQLMIGPSLVSAITANTKRYIELFSSVLDELLPPPDKNLESDDPQDVLNNHRIRQLEDALAAANGGGAAGVAGPRIAGVNGGAALGSGGAASSSGGGAGGVIDLKTVFPAQLLRRYEVRFLAPTTVKPVALRQIGALDLGRLVQVKCIVLRATDVKPQIQVATFICDTCGYELYRPVAGKTFMPIPACTSPECVANKVTGRVNMQTRGCKFTKYQELRVQELPEQVPVGHIPRSMTIVAKGEATRGCLPGDVVVVTGVYLPTPFTGPQAVKAGLTADTYLDAQAIEKVKKGPDNDLSEELSTEIALVADNDPYNTLARSLAPEIFGHEDVKKALLLQLAGGVTQVQADGMKTRGDINICLMGDPGVAKSQLLKHVAKVAPRSVYTTGKGSSGVGLTAAVVRDPITNEMTLEGGALVLGDMGIVMIDEFDKMDESDRTAIHEVMEQQTVSIAKAGITTTLNARTSILAAANPRYGRYNKRADPDAHVALQKNINLPAALLSRFDLLFLLLDTVDADADRALAAHVTYVHQQEEAPPLEFAPKDSHFIRQYISIAKHVDPVVPEELVPYVVEAYVDMRQRDKARANSVGQRSTLTARQLLSILRLAQARARIEMRSVVAQDDVEEAIRLVHVSKASVMESGGGDGSDRPVDSDYMSRLWAIIRDLAMRGGSAAAGGGAGGTHVLLRDAERAITAAGFTLGQLGEFLAEYAALGVIEVNASRTRIDFVMA